MLRKVARITIYIFALIGFALVAVYILVELGITNTQGIVDNQRDDFKQAIKSGQTSHSWAQSEEWDVLKEAILKDKSDIEKASQDSGIESRLIVAILITEQLRLFHSDRELFKMVFAPVKILAVQSQFSWGVMGVKQDTARMIEANLKNKDSDYYLGADFEKALDFTSNDPDKERFERLTNEKEHYYSYLYAALLMKEYTASWNKAGFPIDNKPEIIATLYDIGFKNSKPKANPLSGGAEIKVGRETYSFGGLAGSFYYSEELISEFPRKDQSPK